MIFLNMQYYCGDVFVILIYLSFVIVKSLKNILQKLDKLERIKGNREYFDRFVFQFY